MKPARRNVCRLSTAALLLIAVVGCSSDSDAPAPTPAPGTTPDAPGTTPDTPGTMPDNPGTTPGTTPDTLGTTPDNPGTTPDGPVSAALDGEWTRACSAVDAEEATTNYDIVVLTIDGASGTSNRRLFTDSDCTTPITPTDAAPAESVTTVAIAYPAGTVETALGAAMFVDVTPEDVSRDGTALTAEERETLTALGAFDTVYDIALVDGDALYFGDLGADEMLDGDSAERRPETLESTPYTRQQPSAQ